MIYYPWHAVFGEDFARLKKTCVSLVQEQRNVQDGKLQEKLGLDWERDIDAYLKVMLLSKIHIEAGFRDQKLWDIARAHAQQHDYKHIKDFKSAVQIVNLATYSDGVFSLPSTLDHCRDRMGGQSFIKNCAYSFDHDASWRLESMSTFVHSTTRIWISQNWGRAAFRMMEVFLKENPTIHDGFFISFSELENPPARLSILVA